MDYNKFPYQTKMEDEGMTETRAKELWETLYKLHGAIARLDCINMRTFWNKTLDERMKEFAKTEMLRDITPNSTC